MDLHDVLTSIVSYDELYGLPDGTLIICEVEEVEGTFLLINEEGDWGEFDVINHEIVLTRCFTPELPAILVTKTSTAGEVKTSHLTVVK